MGYRHKVLLVYTNGSSEEFFEVYIRSTPGGFEISKSPDYSESDFIPFSRIDKSACMKANPDEGGWCFISTAVYSTQAKSYQKLNALREFRDDVLIPNKIGRSLVNYYYKVSPPIAKYLKEAIQVKKIVRFYFIDPCVIMALKRKKYLSSGHKFLSKLHNIMITLTYISGLLFSMIAYKFNVGCK